MNPVVIENYTFDNRAITLSWFDTPAVANIRVSQVSAYCIYKGKLVLVKNKRGWGIPGGHPEKGENAQEALERELLEEAGLIAKQYSSKLIGWMKVEDPANEGIEGKEYAQLRYLVELHDLPNFTPNSEIFERTVIVIDDFEKYVSWGNKPTGKAQIMTLKKSLRQSCENRLKESQDL